MMINAIGITLGIVGAADQLEEIIITNLNKSIEDWMEIIIAGGLQITTNNVHWNCPFLTEKCTNNKKTKIYIYHNNEND